MSKGAFYELRGQIAQNVLSRLTAEYGFSKYSVDVMNADATPDIRRPGSLRAFRDIHVPKLLGIKIEKSKIFQSANLC